MVQEDYGPPGVSRRVRDAGPEIGAPRSVVEDPVFDSFLVQNLRGEGNRARFVAGRVGSVDAKLILHPLDSQIGILLQPVGRNFRGRQRRLCRGRILRNYLNLTQSTG